MGLFSLSALGSIASITSLGKDLLESIPSPNKNLATAIAVVNNTDCILNPVQSKFRDGAAFGGTEGEFAETPISIKPDEGDIFAVNQIRGATTDVTGASVFKGMKDNNHVFDLLVGWNIWDLGGIHRRIGSYIAAPNHLLKTSWDDVWNKYVRTPDWEHRCSESQTKGVAYDGRSTNAISGVTSSINLSNDSSLYQK